MLLEVIKPCDRVSTDLAYELVLLKPKKPNEQRLVVVPSHEFSAVICEFILLIGLHQTLKYLVIVSDSCSELEGKFIIVVRKYF